MSYSVYSTRGFVLGSAPSGEASKTYSIYTEDFGLVRARAQSVRTLASKLRYNLDDYSFGTFSLVRGKEFWRVTGAQSEPIFDKESAAARARVLHLVRRLVHGEEPNPELFAILSRLSVKEIGEVDSVVAVLSALGYIDAAAAEGKTEREKIALVNASLRETHL
ncbi:MAG TPA: recombination protein O N-terminal domain-containing protein [Candidatus Paceibacterota bacterium]